VSAGKLELLRPKSSFTLSSPPLAREPDSDEDFPRYSHVELRAKPCCGRPPVAWSLGGGPNACVHIVSTSCDPYSRLYSGHAHRKHDRNASSDRLAAIELGSVTDEDVLLALVLPAGYCSAIQQHLDGVSSRKRCDDFALLGMYRRLRTCGRGRDSRGLVWAVHCAVCNLRWSGVLIIWRLWMSTEEV